MQDFDLFRDFGQEPESDENDDDDDEDENDGGENARR